VSSGTRCRVVWWKFSGVSEGPLSSVLKMSAAGKFETLNKFIPDYTASFSRRQYFS